jgi:hypothetical protein
LPQAHFHAHHLTNQVAQKEKKTTPFQKNQTPKPLSWQRLNLCQRPDLSTSVRTVLKPVMNPLSSPSGSCELYTLDPPRSRNSLDPHSLDLP